MRVLPSLSLLLLLPACRLAAQDQLIQTPDTSLTVSVSDSLTQGLWQNTFDEQETLIGQYYEPTGFNTVADLWYGSDGAYPEQVYSGVPDPSDWGVNVEPFQTNFNIINTDSEYPEVDTALAAGNVTIDATTSVGASPQGITHTWQLSDYTDYGGPPTVTLRYGGITTLDQQVYYNGTGEGVGFVEQVPCDDNGDTVPFAFIVAPYVEGYYALFPDASNALNASPATSIGYYGNFISTLFQTSSGENAFYNSTVSSFVYNDTTGIGLEFVDQPQGNPESGFSYDMLTAHECLNFNQGELGTPLVQVSQLTLPYSPNNVILGGLAVPVDATVTVQQAGDYYLYFESSVEPFGEDGQNDATLSNAGAVPLSLVGIPPEGTTLQPPSAPYPYLLHFDQPGTVTIEADIIPNPQALQDYEGESQYYDTLPSLCTLLAISTSDFTVGDANHLIYQQSAGSIQPPDTAVQIQVDGSTASPVAVAAAAQEPVLVTFTVTNGEPSADTFQLTLTNGDSDDLVILQSDLPSQVQLSPGTDNSVTYHLVVMGDSALIGNDPVPLTLAASSLAATTAQGTSSYAAQATASITITQPSASGFTLTAVPGTTFAGVWGLTELQEVQLTNQQDVPDTFTIQLGTSDPSVTIPAYSWAEAQAGGITDPVAWTDEVIELISTDGGSFPVVSMPVPVDPGATVDLYVPVIASVGTTGPTTVSILAASTNSGTNASVAFTDSFAAPTIITGPVLDTAVVNTLATLTYTVTNPSTLGDTFYLESQLPESVTDANVPSSIYVGPQSSQTFTVTFVLTALTTGTPVTLTAVDALTGFSQPVTTTVAVVAGTGTIPSGAVAVTPPPAVQVGAGTPVTLTFTVTNNETANDSYALSLVVPPGVTVVSVQQPLITSAPSSVRTAPGALLQPVALDMGQTATIVVVVVPNPGAAGGVEDVQLVATSLGNGAITDTATAQITVPGVGSAPTAGRPVTLTSSNVPASSAGHTVYLPIAPGTPEGNARLEATIAGLGTQAVGYSFDAVTQAFVQLPAVPSLGVQSTTAFYVATATDLSIDCSGTSTVAPATIVLQPGWNFVGVPPIDPGTSTSVLTTHQFPDDFDLLDGTGALVTSADTFADTLGTVGSGDPTTAEPFLFDGTAYHQVATLASGTGYWIKNNTSTPVTLQRVLAGASLSRLQPRTTATYTDRGQPPTPPSASVDGASGGGGCGGGSGASVVLMGLLLLVRGSRSARPRRR